MIPNTFLIGAPKCGTTALAKYLSDHPQVYFSTPKEPFFWAKDLVAAPHELRPKSMSEYLALFSAAIPEHKVIAEGSTSYLRSITAVPDILKFNPAARFIVMLRNPTEVVQAFHMEQIYAQHENELDFARAWSLQPDREAGRNLPPRAINGDFVLYRKTAAFAGQIERFISVVPQSQRHIIIYDDFKADPRRVYLDALRFLNLQDDGRQDFNPVNASHVQRFPFLARLILYPPKPLQGVARSARRRLQEKPSPLVNKVKSLMNVEKQRETISEDALHDVQMFFSSDVNRLSEILGRDLHHWNGRSTQ